MTKRIIPLFIILFVIKLAELFAQVGWTTYNFPTINGYLFYAQDMKFSNMNTGVVSGRIIGSGNVPSGYILGTTNGGVNWSTIYTFSNGSCGDMCFINSNTGFCVCSPYISTSGSGRLIRTDDGGLSWYTVNSFSGKGINTVQFIDANTGYLNLRTQLTDGLYKTTNGGVNFNLIGPIDYGFRKIYFIDANTGFLSSASNTSNIYFWKTTDAGNNWVLNSQDSLLVNDLYFNNDLIGFASGTYNGYGCIAKTTNGGVNWIVKKYSWDQAENGIYFSDVNTGYVTGYSGTYKTTNSGTNWNPLLGTGWCISFVSRDSGFVAWSNISKTISGGSYFLSGPSLLTPTNGSLNQLTNLSLDWQDLSNATSYRVQVATDSLFQNISLDSSYLTISQLSVPVGRLTNNTKYYWRAQGFLDPQYSPWSSVWNFTTILSNPNLISPTNSSTGITLSPLLDWGDVTGATTYNVQVATNSGFTTPIIDLSGLTSSQYQVPSSILQGNTLYYWRVSASNSNGTSNWATVWNFTTIASPNTPTLISPTNGSNILTLTPTMDWSDVTTAISYTLQIATDTNFISLTVNQSGLTTSQYLIPSGTLTGNTTYYWRAKAVNEAGSGPWSVRWNFRVVTTPPAPNLVSPLNNSTNQPPTVFLDWDSLAAATSYRIQLATDSLFNSITYDTIGVTRSYLLMRPGILLANVKYYWRVNATNLAGTGLWSVIWNFRVSPTGVSQYSSEIPKEFKLYNNYPNPFNPTTNIKFDIPKSTGVKVSIYDISGRLINQPINEFLNAGRYELTWNAANIASGVYFYRIETESFTDVKRMLLIK